MRLTFSGVTFTITTGGLGLNTGSAEFAGTTEVELEVAVPDFVVSTAAGQASVSFDLNVEDWLTDVMLNLGVIENDELDPLTAVVTSG